MESRAQEIRSENNPNIRISVIPGHFATSHSHINHYIDLTRPKCRYKDAKLVAEELAAAFGGQQIDTIVCMDDTQMIAAFLAEQLSETMNNASSGNNISVIVPEFNTNNQMIFRDNIQKMVWKKKILLLIASATTGKTIHRALECLNYYSGETVGVAAIFSATDSIDGICVHSVFGVEDIPEYRTYSYRECPACAGKYKIDAIVNSHGYSKL